MTRSISYTEGAQRQARVARSPGPTRSESLRVARLIIGRLARRPGVPLAHLRAFVRVWFAILRGRSGVGPSAEDRRFRRTEIVTELAPGGHIGLFMGSRTLREQWGRIGAWIRETSNDVQAA